MPAWLSCLLICKNELSDSLFLIYFFLSFFFRLSYNALKVFVVWFFSFCSIRCLSTTAWNIYSLHSSPVLSKLRFRFSRQVSTFATALFQAHCVTAHSFEFFFFYWRYNPLWVCVLQPSGGALASRTRFLDHTQRRATVRRTPLDEWSVRRRDLYLTTQNTHNRQTSMPWVGFETTIVAGERQ